MKVVIINDVHLSDRPPSIRTDSYTDDIFAKLDWIMDSCETFGVESLVFSGDVFHSKTPSRTSHALVQRMCDFIHGARSRGVKVHIVPGNHDISHDRLDSLDRQPLGVLFKAGAHLLVGHDEATPELFGIPWLQDWNELPQWMERWRQSRAKLLVTHAPISKQPKPYFTISTEDWAQGMGAPGYVAFGHMHDPDGIMRVPYGSGLVIFANEGALSRGSLHAETIARKPAVALWDSSDGFHRIEVPHRPAREVFRLAEHEGAQEKVQRLDEFLTKIGSTTLERVSVEQVLVEMRGRGVSEEVLREAEECLEVAT